MYFIGRRRGEIAVWPDEPTPRWQAVWAVPFRRRGRAIFCGPSLADADPLPERAGDRSNRKLWHDLLWRRRKQITPPRNRAQRSLWRRYGSAPRVTVRPGDALLYAASAVRDMTWETFKRIVDATCVPDAQLATEMRYVRAEAVDVGGVLGHWEVVRTGAARRIVVAPPVLARLPWPGLPRAVLCGSRSPDTVAEIREVCDSIGGLSLSMSAQLHHPYAPMRAELSGESEEQMIAVGRELSVRYDPTPAAWSIARARAAPLRATSVLSHGRSAKI